MGNGLFHFALVGRTDVKNVFLYRLVQCHRPGRGRHQGHTMPVGQRRDALRVRCATRHEKRQHTPVFDQRAGVLQGQCRIEPVVQRHELDGLAVHTAPAFTGAK